MYLGSGWTTVAINSVMASLNYNQSGGHIPLGNTLLPMICITNNNQVATLIEVQWKGANGVICRDTFSLDCSDCGDMKVKIVCKENGTWTLASTLTNNTNYTITKATITWTLPSLSTYNQVINVGSLAPGMSYGTFNIPMGAPAVAGQMITAVVTLHNDNNEICCNFAIKITLPDCGGGGTKNCECDHDFAVQVDKGFSVTNASPKFTFNVLGQFNPDCDKIIWDFGDGTSVGTLGSTTSVMHTYSTPGKYLVCMTVIRTTKDGKECRFKFTKEVKVKSIAQVSLYPNPTTTDATLIFDPLEIGNDYMIDVLNNDGTSFKKMEGVVKEENMSVPLPDHMGIYFIKVNTKDSQKVLKVMRVD